MPSANRNVSHRQVARVLAGASSYDALSEQEQAIVRQNWTERVRIRREALIYAERFSAAGESYSEADEDGNLAVHPAANGSTTGSEPSTPPIGCGRSSVVYRGRQ